MPDPFGGSLEEYRQSRNLIRQMILGEFCQGSKVDDPGHSKKRSP
jgi:hypothetical protein